jgi:hypothetical protein
VSTRMNHVANDDEGCPRPQLSAGSMFGPRN